MPPRYTRAAIGPSSNRRLWLTIDQRCPSEPTQDFARVLYALARNIDGHSKSVPGTSEVAVSLDTVERLCEFHDWRQLVQPCSKLLMPMQDRLIGWHVHDIRRTHRQCFAPVSRESGRSPSLFREASNGLAILRRQGGCKYRRHRHLPNKPIQASLGADVRRPAPKPPRAPPRRQWRYHRDQTDKPGTSHLTDVRTGTTCAPLVGSADASRHPIARLDIRSTIILHIRPVAHTRSSPPDTSNKGP
jgi:hypothetical protein